MTYRPFFDWDFWPWLVAEEAGGIALPMYRMERGIRSVQAAIAWHLAPAIRQAAKEIRKLLPADGRV